MDIENAAEKPRVGLGVIVENDSGLILVGKRIGSHAPYWSIPGGRLKLGESFEVGAKRELREEFDIDIEEPKVIAVTNNLRTYKTEGLHYISVILWAKKFRGEPRIVEQDKCAEFAWCDPHKLPQPHFDASELGVQCWLEGSPYVGLAE